MASIVHGDATILSQQIMRWEKCDEHVNIDIKVYTTWPVCLLESIFFFKVNFRKMNYFLMFGSVMKNKLENTF